jgi:hypothetical protein
MQTRGSAVLLRLSLNQRLGLWSYEIHALKISELYYRYSSIKVHETTLWCLSLTAQSSQAERGVMAPFWHTNLA